MRLSRFFSPFLKENPVDAQIDSHRLMVRGGYIQQSASGVYIWLPLGLRVLEKISRIIREELTQAGALEILMPTIQLADLWKTTGRYASYGEEMLRLQDRHGRDLLYGPTNEEVVTDLFSKTVTSYKDLPLNLFHIQWKFRDEMRPRFGVMRAREFLMKDAYSFDLTEKEARLSYQKMFVAYLRIFNQLGVQVLPVQADTGPIGGDLSHEFVLLAENGESDIFYDCAMLTLKSPPACYQTPKHIEDIFSTFTHYYAVTSDKHDALRFSLLPEDRRQCMRGIEVGHVFYFADKYSKPLGARVHDKEGHERIVHMGSYGIGVSRLVGALIEVFKDERGITWPIQIAPFPIGLINLRSGQSDLDAFCDDLYSCIERSGHQVLYDDTDLSVGKKLTRMDLIGIPWQVIVGPESFKNNYVELKNRTSGEVIHVSKENAAEHIQTLLKNDLIK